MKRIICLMVAITAFSFVLPVRAQRIHLGAIGGLNFSDMKGTGEKEITGKTVFGIGGVIDIRLVENLSLCLEPMYIRKCARAEEFEEDPAIDVKMAFLELPVLLKYSVGSSVRPYIMVGASIGYLLSSELEADIS